MGRHWCVAFGGPPVVGRLWWAAIGVSPLVGRHWCVAFGGPPVVGRLWWAAIGGSPLRLQVWEDYFKELLNESKNSELELPSAVEGEVKLEIRDAEVERKMKKTKKGRVTGIDEVRVEMLAMAERVGVRGTMRLLNIYKREGKVTEEWRTGLIVPVWKRKGDTHENIEASRC